MSHFTVMVIGDNPEEQLAPYQENNMGDCPEKYLKFNNAEDEMLEEYDEGSIQMAVLPTGERVYPWSQEAKNLLPAGVDNVNDLPEGSDLMELKDFKYTEIFDTFEDFAEDYHGYDGRDEKSGKYGYWENPNAKWDWYQLGGRWNGFFKLKPGGKGTPGPAGLMGSPAPSGTADQARKGDIDIEGIQEEAAQQAEDRWNLMVKHFGSEEKFKLEFKWEDLIKDAGEGFDYDSARKKYQSQPAMELSKQISKDLREAKHPDADHFVWVNLRDYQCTKEEYIGKAMAESLQTFAFLKDGEWVEKGEMGWFALVVNEKEPKDWNKEFMKMFHSLPEDTLISIYDCHI